MKTFNNPILSGFYPDPSICRVGDDYYLATSSFVYFPGIPIFHSKDLVHWEQIGHAIHDVDQLDYKNCETSLGLWAPSLHWHEGTFYLINTFVSEGREARRDNYIVTAKNAAGPWSKPVFVEGADGIDSSLFFHEDGSLWYAGNYICAEPQYEGHHGIYLCELDPQTFQFIGQRRIIWDGIKTRSKWIEAPHIYKIDSWYYLMVAEGGTFDNHCVMMARSRTIDGDYEICPRNPIVTHRHLSLMHPISVVGHGDMFETQNGEWWLVLLGVRPYEGFNYNLGRETFLVPLRWEKDGWPAIDTPYGLVDAQVRLPLLPVHNYPLPASCDHFDDPQLSLQWNFIHPPKHPFHTLTDRPGFLRLHLLPEVIDEICTPAFIGRRQQHKSCQITTKMHFIPQSAHEESGIVLIQDDRFNYVMVKALKDEKQILRLYRTDRGMRCLITETPLADHDALYLMAVSHETQYDFYFGYSEHVLMPLHTGAPASLLSSTRNEGFTGVYMGVYASSNHAKSNNFADFDYFTYESSTTLKNDFDEEAVQDVSDWDDFDYLGETPFPHFG